jgi:hypothetical protein
MLEFDARNYNIHEFVARENITRFEHQLVMASDEPERRLVAELLREEKDNLAAVLAGLTRQGKAYGPRSAI